MPRTARNGATIVDIARKLGVSAMTVSRALTGSPEVSEKTRQRVLRCARELGYRPNRWARSLVSRKSSIVGVVVPDIGHSYFAEITHGVEEVVDKAGYDLLLCHSAMDPEREKSEIEMLVESQAEGLIVASEQPEKSPEVFERLREGGIPFVLIDRYFDGCAFASVRVDDVAVGRAAAECLIGLGHRDIGCIQGPPISPAQLRYRGFADALKHHGLPLRKQWTARGRFDIDSGREAMKALLAEPSCPTAVFASNDPMGIGAIYACRDAGLRVPDDMSIVGAGNIEGAHHPNPFLTTIDWPREELGRVAATFLIDAIRNGGNADQPVRVFEPRVLERQSTAPLVS
jgi:LacI family transcriptional regulator